MNIKSTILLALVFAGLCAAYGWREWRAQDTVKKADEAKLVFDWTGDDVREIAITRVGEKTVRAARAEAGGWTISEPHPTIVPFVLLWDRVVAIDLRKGQLIPSRFVHSEGKSVLIISITIASPPAL